jgi:ABC-type molybdate transport system substrate-binding protein
MTATGSLRRLVLLGLIFLAAPVSVAVRADQLPPDIVILSEPTLRPLLVDLDKLWRAKNIGRLRIFTSTTDAALKQAGLGARADVIFGAGAANADAGMAAGLIKSADLIGAWSDPLLLASDHPKNKGDDQPIAQVIADGPIATITGSLSDQGLAALGLAQALLTRHISAAGSEDAVWLLARGKVSYAVLFASDIKADSHFIALRALPADMAPPRAIWAGESSNARSSEMTRFAAFLKEKAIQDVIAAHGLIRSVE